MRTILIVSISLILSTSLSLAKIINVPADHSTMREGINAATDGDTVLVQPGTYDESINFGGKNIVVSSLFLTTGDASYISNTVITGGDYKVYRVVYFANGEDSTAVLNGFTITEGITYFGGIECSEGSGPTLMNLIVSSNTVHFSGGGITCKRGASPTLINVTIRGNTSDFGSGGIFCWESEMNLINVTIVENAVTSIGGGGITCWESEMNLINVTICGNEARSGDVISCGMESEMTLVNTIVWNNISYYPSLDSVDVFYSDIKGGWSGIENIDSYPMFVDTANGDYRLQEGSPCIDAGIQDTFIVYNNGLDTLFIPPMDYMGSAPDIGAFESDPDNPLTNIEKQSILPQSYNLKQNYPNPFNPSTTIEFSLPKSKFVTLKVFNILGEKITTIVNKKLQAGNHTFKFDGSNLASGVYLYRIEAGEFSDVKKMVILH